MTIKEHNLVFNKAESVTIDGDLSTYIPSGYKWARDGYGGNENWFYIIPKDYSEDLDHIDAKPMSFAITSIPVFDLPESVNKDSVDACKEMLLNNNVLQYGVAIYDCICSEHCFFIYQNWEDSDSHLYNKINGILFARDRMYQFHSFLNHEAPIAADEGVQRQFELTTRQWMKNVVLSNDKSYEASGDPDEVKATIEDVARLVKQFKEKLLPTLQDDFGENLKKSYALIAGMFYLKNGKQIDSEKLRSISYMVGEIDGRQLSKEDMLTLLKEHDANRSSITEAVRGFLHDSVMKQLVMLDKATVGTMDGGLTIVHFEGIKELLKVLCGENDIEYDTNTFCLECVQSTRILFNEKWEEIDVHSLDESTLIIRQSDFAHQFNAEQEQKECISINEETRAEDIISSELDDSKTSSERNDIRMFVSIINEEKMGKGDRKANEFYRKYKDRFTGLNKKELIALRETIQTQMSDESQYNQLREEIMNTSVRTRFHLATKNYFNVTETADYSQKADESIEETTEWFTEAEADEVKELMNEELNRIKSRIDKQLSSVDTKWTEWKTAKADLKVVVRDDSYSQIEVLDDCKLFQVKRRDGVDGQKMMVEVIICKYGVPGGEVNLMDAFPMYWGVPYKDIWEVAIQNGIVNEVEDLSDGMADYHVTEAFTKVRRKNPSATKLKNKQKRDEKEIAEVDTLLSELDVICLYAVADYEKNCEKDFLISGLQNDYKKATSRFQGLKQKQISHAFKEMQKVVAEGGSEAERYESEFRSLSTDERFRYITQPVFDRYFLKIHEQQFAKNVAEAMKYTGKWYDQCELVYVEKKLEFLLHEFGKEMDESYGHDYGYMLSYENIKNDLRIRLNSHVINMDDFFTIDEGEYRCELYVKADDPKIIPSYHSEAMPWYWGVSKAEVWRQAFQNGDVDISWINMFNHVINGQSEARIIAEEYVNRAAQNTYVSSCPYERNKFYAEIEPYDIVTKNVKKEYGELSPETIRAYLDSKSTTRSQVSDDIEALRDAEEETGKRYEVSSDTHDASVVVDDIWTIRIPGGYKYCTDKKTIGRHRNIIFMEDKADNEFDNPFGASVSFTSMYDETEDFPAVQMAIIIINTLAGDHEVTVLKDENELYVAFCFTESTDKVDGGRLDIFKAVVGCGNGVSSFQVFFNDSELTRRQQQAFVKEVFSSVRLKKDTK